MFSTAGQFWVKEFVGYRRGFERGSDVRFGSCVGLGLHAVMGHAGACRGVICKV